MSAYRPTLALPRDAAWMAIRYGRGRATYADQIARQILRAAWPHMTWSERENTRSDTAEHLRLVAHTRDMAVTAGSAAHWRHLYEHMHEDALPPELPGTPIYDNWDDWEAAP